MRHTALMGLLAILALTCTDAATLSELHAQQHDAIPQVSAETLTSYARAFEEINAVRDEIHAELAAPTNKSLEVQTELRERMNEEVAAVLETHGLTQEQYSQITLLVSVDQAYMDRFNEILKRPSGDTEEQ